MKQTKPVPTDMRAWVRELCGTRQYLKHLGEAETEYLPKWRMAQRDYYSARLTEIMDNPPKIPTRYRWNKYCRGK